ncbi:MAG: energy transducer TonB [Gemmatimonas sp.]
MSLHLIESTRTAPKDAQRGGGATASVVVHMLLVAGAFTVASAAPIEKQPIEKQELIYHAPEPVPVPQPAVETQPSSNATASPIASPAAVAPAIPELTSIPVDIPPINLESRTDWGAIDFAKRTARGTTGIGEGGVGTGATTTTPGAVHSYLQVDRQVNILSGYRVPRYPESLRSMGIEETVNATFVVDTLGRIESGSLDLSGVRHMAFASAVREALANARFRPAEVAGRPVRQRVAQAFVFSIQR